MNDSARFSGGETGGRPGGKVATRLQSDHLSLTGRAGQGVVAYRSEFLHLWVLGPAGSDPALVVDALADLELSFPKGAIPPPGVTLPLEVQHLLSGLQFLHESLWEGHLGLAGLLLFEGRVWAVQSELDTSLEQMTGAPIRFQWHEWDGLSYAELAAGEVWRLGLPLVDGGLFAHYRPALREVPAEDTWTAAASAQERESRQARRRRRKREQAVIASVAPLEIVPPVAVPKPPQQISTPRVVRKRFALTRRSLVVAGVVAAALVAIGATLIAVRKPIAAMVAGQYALDLTTSPAGARVRVDGKPVAGKTPFTLGLTPGEHKVEVYYGEYANAVFTVDGARGDKRSRSFAWTGSFGVASADSSVRLAVTLDGQPIGTAPLWRDSVPVGRHRLGFRAPGVRAWEEEVQVRANQSARVTASPVKVPPYGLVTARAELVTSDGVEDLDGIPVFVDGTHAGATPVDLKLDPGPHSIRIARDAGAPSIHLIDVQAGGRFFASAEFGRPADPLVAFEAPTHATTAPIVVRLAADMPLPIRQSWLHLRPLGGDWVRLPIAWQGSQGTFRFPLDRMPSAKSLSYYVEIETREGEEYFSELRTIPIVP